MRRLPLLLACVLLGGITSVTLAWACRLNSCFHTPAWRSGIHVEEPLAWDVLVWVRFGGTSYRLTEHHWTALSEIEVLERQVAECPSVRRRLVLDVLRKNRARQAEQLALVERLEPPRWPDRPRPYGVITAMAAGEYGWPARCMGAVVYTRRGPAGAGQIAHWNWNLTRWRRTPSSMSVSVPLRPLPLGLAVNTAAYATVWGAVLLGLPALRRRRRRRAGRCHACGYSLAALTSADGRCTCPECGASGPLLPPSAVP